ncbi:MAG TPA: hypothetical protein VFU63_04840 [Ktedonobacterales bacterium]|nr:hypothetical protein [Ktedonobacterales bacterium]
MMERKDLRLLVVLLARSKGLALLAGAIQATERAGADRELRERILTVLLDGLRPTQRR